MIIVQRKLFTDSIDESQDNRIDISHLPPSKQKEIIRRERRKIELDGKIQDTAKGVIDSRRRSRMSLKDNATLGAREIKGSAAVNTGAALASFAAGSKVSSVITEGAARLLGAGEGLSSTLGYAGRMAVSGLVPKVTEGVGKAVGAVKGALAKPIARRKERKLNRLLQERQNLENQ